MRTTPNNQKEPQDEENPPVGYLPIDSYAVIGNLRTAALVGLDGSIDFMCFPTFDSPSVFARLLDQRCGGHFHVYPVAADGTMEGDSDGMRRGCVSSAAPQRAFVVRKQQYLPNSNVLVTRFQSDDGAVAISDWMPRPAKRGGALVPWVVRKVEAVRGLYRMRAECFPAFDYARATHSTQLLQEEDAQSQQLDKGRVFLASPQRVVFQSGPFTEKDSSCSEMALDLRTLVVLGRDRELVPQLAAMLDGVDDSEPPPAAALRSLYQNGIQWTVCNGAGLKGPGVTSEFTLTAGMCVYFILRQTPASQARTDAFFAQVDADRSGLDEIVRGLQDEVLGLSACTSLKVGSDNQSKSRVEQLQQDLDRRTVAAKMRQCPLFTNNNSPADPPLTLQTLETLEADTLAYWRQWLSRTTYTGRWRETVLRSALLLKLLVYEPTGAVVAAPTFGLPEALGGVRNWDYRYTWIRDSAFTVYALIRLGLTEEAEGYMRFVYNRCMHLGEGEALPLMFSIHGTEVPDEAELGHLEGYRGSRPVRIGNGARDHLQLDIYGALLDAVYLYNKYARPIGCALWEKVCGLVDYVCDHWTLPDNSIWEVRGSRQHFTYSKVMCWVALDRGLRLAEKRSLPCPSRDRWLAARDAVHQDVLRRAFNPDLGAFVMGYGDDACFRTVDASVLIMALTFFISHADARFLGTLRQILRPPEAGGLVANNTVFRYNLGQFADGLDGAEGTFSMCTFWLIEALTRVGKSYPACLDRALLMFEQMVGFGSHVQLFSEEIALSGESLGNHPQAFTHIALISAAFNLDRQLPQPGRLHSA